MLIRYLLKISVVIFVMLQPLAYAGTTAFGMTLGETTLKEFKKEYPSAVDEGISEWSGGSIFSVPAQALDFDGVKRSYVIFTKDEKVTAIIIELNNKLFDRIHGMLSKKYKVSKKNIPFVGNKFVRYKNGDDTIELDAPHMSFDMTLYYAEKNFMDQYKEKKQIMDEKKELSESDKL
ncbi:hypothetical protein [Escherichia coli]|nr:hypothetical protein [Escherichia coli]MWR25038.1 hypothetical protein [Escherichia coli]MWS02079.1 hypothetical protein [Escherichia coli]MWS07009.1 hypothetical protein [Escherichia coli]MWS45052.1 hypothetical protein [Escherichia coli]MWS55283.1 hypothetical protein [Escherichia coli]